MSEPRAPHETVSSMAPFSGQQTVTVAGDVYHLRSKPIVETQPQATSPSSWMESAMSAVGAFLDAPTKAVVWVSKQKDSPGPTPLAGASPDPISPLATAASAVGAFLDAPTKAAVWVSKNRSTDGFVAFESANSIFSSALAIIDAPIVAAVGFSKYLQPVELPATPRGPAELQQYARAHVPSTLVWPLL